jgi:ElaB/YqjD/DUF883 family membrane-anchored ribosome-binding protein
LEIWRLAARKKPRFQSAVSATGALITRRATSNREPATKCRTIRAQTPPDYRLLTTDYQTKARPLQRPRGLVILSSPQQEETMDETTNPNPSAGSDAGSDEANRFNRARDYVSDQYQSASGKVRDGYNAMRERVEDVDIGAVTDQVRTYVRSNPGKALLISVGVGFLIGLLLRRDDEE